MNQEKASEPFSESRNRASLRFSFLAAARPFLSCFCSAPTRQVGLGREQAARSRPDKLVIEDVVEYFPDLVVDQEFKESQHYQRQPRVPRKIRAVRDRRATRARRE